MTELLSTPGMNIHRNPLNGRNFEYISEDPLVTGKMAATQIKGLGIVGSTGTIKHFATNNQEHKRREVEAVVSVRALREIYLRGFEIAVREGHARSVMTTYGPLNGLWTASNYDLNTIVLRKDWGFTGIVMTDWWAAGSDENQPSSVENRAGMVEAQNDMYMVTSDCTDLAQDNVKEALENGRVTRGMLQRNARNILGFILQSPAMLYEMDMISGEEIADAKSGDEDEIDYSNVRYYKPDENGDVIIPGEGWNTNQGQSVVVGIEVDLAEYDLEVVSRSPLDDLAQISITVFYDSILKMVLPLRGSNGKWMNDKFDFGGIVGKNHYIRFYFGATGLEIDHIALRYRKKLELPF